MHTHCHPSLTQALGDNRSRGRTLSNDLEFALNHFQCLWVPKQDIAHLDDFRKAVVEFGRGKAAHTAAGTERLTVCLSDTNLTPDVTSVKGLQMYFKEFAAYMNPYMKPGPSEESKIPQERLPDSDFSASAVPAHVDSLPKVSEPVKGSHVPSGRKVQRSVDMHGLKTPWKLSDLRNVSGIVYKASRGDSSSADGTHESLVNTFLDQGTVAASLSELFDLSHEQAQKVFEKAKTDSAFKERVKRALLDA